MRHSRQFDMNLWKKWNTRLLPHAVKQPRKVSRTGKVKAFLVKRYQRGREQRHQSGNLHQDKLKCQKLCLATRTSTMYIWGYFRLPFRFRTTTRSSKIFVNSGQSSDSTGLSVMKMVVTAWKFTPSPLLLLNSTRVNSHN